MPFSAHPKVDQDGSLWNFGALPFADRLAPYRIGADGAVLQAGVVEVPQLAMVHDFAVSARHLVFLVAPYDMLPDASLSFAERHAWAGSGPQARPMRAVVVSKATLQVRQVFELDPRMMFHFGNAWDDGDVTRLDAVLHDGDVIASFDQLMRGKRQPNVPARSYAAQFTRDFVSGKAQAARLFGAREFPRVMPQMVARRHRKLALLSSAPRNRDLILDTVNLVDTDTGKADSYRFDVGWQAEEHVLVPRRNARSETDGYLVGVAQDTRRGQTMMTVFDDRCRLAVRPDRSGSPGRGWVDFERGRLPDPRRAGRPGLRAARLAFARPRRVATDVSHRSDQHLCAWARGCATGSKRLTRRGRSASRRCCCSRSSKTPGRAEQLVVSRNYVDQFKQM